MSLLSLLPLPFLVRSVPMQLSHSCLFLLLFLSIANPFSFALGNRQTQGDSPTRFMNPAEFFREEGAPTPQKAMDFAPGGAYLAGRYAQLNTDRNIDPVPYFLQSIRREGALFAQAAFEAMLDLLPDSEESTWTTQDTEQILEALEDYLQQNQHSQSRALRTLGRRLAEYYYDTEADQRLLRHIQALDAAGGGSTTDPEVLLWLIVATYRTSGALDPNQVARLNQDFRASGIHWRLARYIQVRPELEAAFDPEIYALLSTKAAISQGQFRGSVDQLFARYLPSANENLLWDLYNGALQADRGTPGSTLRAAELFAAQAARVAAAPIAGTAQVPDSAGGALVAASAPSAAPAPGTGGSAPTAATGSATATGSAPATAATGTAPATGAVPTPLRLQTLLELSGRAWALAGNNQRALETFASVLKQPAHSDTDRDRILWNWFRSGIRRGSEVALGQLPELASQISTPNYFDDLLQDFVSQLIREQRWVGVLQLHQTLGSKLSGPVGARVAWIGAEILRLELVVSENFPSRSTLLERAANQNEDPYYQMVAREALGRVPTLPSVAGVQLGNQTLEYPPQAYEDFIRRLYAAGLRTDGYEWTMGYSGTLEPESIEEVAQAHIQVGEYIDGMRLIERWIRVARPPVISAELTRLRYPLAFEAEMNQVVEERNLNRFIFYGLVREESYFDADIRSAVGATGLSQLMPATAAEMATLLRLREPVLTDPLTNLSLGGYYFRRLLNRFELPLYGLIAYNGGQGRLSSWLREPWSRSTILLHEGLPFEETRNYVRKILVSAVHYEGLADPGNAQRQREIVEVFFPELL